MPLTRKRALQQQHLRQEQQLQEHQQRQQQEQQPLQQQQAPSGHHDNKHNNNNEDTIESSPKSQQPITRAQINKAKQEKEKPQESSDREVAVNKDIQTVLEGDLYCAICREVYIDPLILNCAHSFCKFCLNHWLSKKVGCPSCRMVVVFQTENLALKDIVTKMVSSSSPEFQAERNQSLEQRLEAEQRLGVKGVKPIMWSKSFNKRGHSRRIYERGGLHLRAWRGPNGATIWRTNLDQRGQIVTPEPESDSDEETPSEDRDTSDAGDHSDDHVNNNSDDDYEDEDFAYDTETGQRRHREDDSSASTIDIDDSDGSYEASRRIRMNHLQILAGNLPADDDADFEMSDNDQSDADSSMQDVESSEHSGTEMFDIWNLTRRRRDEMSTDEEEGTDEESESDRNEQDGHQESTDDDEENGPQEDHQGDATDEDEDEVQEDEQVESDDDRIIEDVSDHDSLDDPDYTGMSESSTSIDTPSANLSELESDSDSSSNSDSSEPSDYYNPFFSGRFIPGGRSTTSDSD